MSSRRAPRALDDRELIAAILDRLAGGRPFAPGKLAGALEAEGLRLELEGTITRAPARDKIAEYRTAALAELEKTPRLATRCGVHTKKRSAPGWSSRGGGQCESKTIVAALVFGSMWRPAFRFVFVCGRHLEAHGYDLAAIEAVVTIAPYQLSEPRRRAAEEERAAERRRREEDAEIERRAVADFECRECAAAPGEKCRPMRRAAGGGRLEAYVPIEGDIRIEHPHYDRRSDAEDRIREERTAAALRARQHEAAHIEKRARTLECPRCRAAEGVACFREELRTLPGGPSATVRVADPTHPGRLELAEAQIREEERKAAAAARVSP